MDPNTGRIYDPKEIEDLPEVVRERLVHGSREELEKLQAHIYAEGIQGFTPVLPPIIDEAQELGGIEQAFWNGIPIDSMRGTAIVADAPEFPEYWARDIIGERIPVVMVNLDGANDGGGIDYLDNRENHGWAKVTTGKGSPSYGHRNISIVEGSFEPDPDDVKRKAEEFQEILDAFKDLKTSVTPAEKFYPINRAARRKAARDEKKERKQKFVNKPKRKEVRDIGS